jgi:predicted secreted acid phosphatase
MNLSGRLAGTAILAGLIAAGTVTQAQWLADVSTDLAPAWAYVEQYVADPTADRPAIVLDIDNTSLQTYFHPITVPAVPQVLDLVDYAHDHGISIFFVTARPDFIAPITRFTLEKAGYPVDGLYGRDLGDLFEPVQEFKTDMRTDIENQGYTIIANIGNNWTDLEGGHAEATFKLPDYNGLLS